MKDEFPIRVGSYFHNGRGADWIRSFSQGHTISRRNSSNVQSCLAIIGGCSNTGDIFYLSVVHIILKYQKGFTLDICYGIQL